MARPPTKDGLNASSSSKHASTVKSLDSIADSAHGKRSADTDLLSDRSHIEGDSPGNLFIQRTESIDHPRSTPARNRMRSVTAVKNKQPPIKHPADPLGGPRQFVLDHMNTSFSQLSGSVQSIVSEDADENGTQASLEGSTGVLLRGQGHGLPMTLDDPIGPVSISRQSSIRRLGKRRDSTGSQVVDEMREVLRTLSHNVNLRRLGSSASVCASVAAMSPSASLYKARGFHPPPTSIPTSGEETPSVPGEATAPPSPRVNRILSSAAITSHGGSSQRTDSPSPVPHEEDSILGITDVRQLQQMLIDRNSELVQAVELGQCLLRELDEKNEQLQECEEEVKLLEEERDVAFKEFKQLQREHRQIIDQLKDARSTIIQLKTVQEHQRAEIQEVKEEMQHEKEVFEQKQEELAEEAKWHEEQATLAIKEANDRAGREKMEKLMIAATERQVRKIYFSKLRGWREENLKRRRCFHILTDNMKMLEEGDRRIRARVLRRWRQFTELNILQRQHGCFALEVEEGEQRSLVIDGYWDGLADLLSYVSSEAVLGWMESQMKGEETANILEETKREWEQAAEHLRERTELQLKEGRQRRDMTLFLVNELSALYFSALAETREEWLSSRNEAVLRDEELGRVRKQWADETDTLRQQSDQNMVVINELKEQLTAATNSSREAEATGRVYEAEVYRLRNAHQEVLSQLHPLRTALQVKEAELIKARGQLELQLTRAQRHAETVRQEEAVSPILKKAVALTSDLRKHAEATRRFVGASPDRA